MNKKTIVQNNETAIWENSKPVENLSEYFEIINEISLEFGNSKSLWFRGHSKNKYKLIPSIYRNDILEKYSKFTEYESFKLFKRKCGIENKNDFEYYYLMQHYGCPTRLLDWTESSLIALFFALFRIDNCENPVVWVIEPYAFNSMFLSESTIFFFYGNEIDKRVKSYFLGKSETKSIPDKPVAVFPAYYDNRVIAQKSCFTLFGSNKTPIDDLISYDLEFPLAKIRISKDNLINIQDEIITSGINYYTIMPDLEGLSKEIRKQYKMKI